jgi:hypothetical protein
LRRTLLSSAERFLLTLWIGGMWVTGYAVTPVLFATLDDRMLAGNIAGRLFDLLSWVGLACGVLLLILYGLWQGHAGRRRWRLWVLGVMLLVTLVGAFGLAPAMQQLKQAAGSALVPGTDLYRQFARLHGLSSSLFLLNSFLGLALVIGVPSGRGRDAAAS